MCPKLAAICYLTGIWNQAAHWRCKGCSWLRIGKYYWVWALVNRVCLLDHPIAHSTTHSPNDPGWSKQSLYNTTANLCVDPIQTYSSYSRLLTIITVCLAAPTYSDTSMSCLILGNQHGSWKKPSGSDWHWRWNACELMQSCQLLKIKIKQKTLAQDTPSQCVWPWDESWARVIIMGNCRWGCLVTIQT